MNRQLFAFVFLASLFLGSPVFASSQTYDCSFFTKYGAGSSACSSNVITFTSGDNFYFDNASFPFTATLSGYVYNASTLYYVVIDSPSGSGTGALGLVNQDGSQETNADFTAGAGVQEISFSSPATGSYFTFGVKSNNGGSNVSAGTTIIVDTLCVSDVSFAECTGGGGGSPPPAVGSTTVATSTLQLIGTNAIGFAILITIAFIYLIAYLYNSMFKKKPWRSS